MLNTMRTFKVVSCNHNPPPKKMVGLIKSPVFLVLLLTPLTRRETVDHVECHEVLEGGELQAPAHQPTRLQLQPV